MDGICNDLDNVVSFFISVLFAPFSMFAKIGYGGVDICFLASGIGCYFSLNKNPDILEFYKRRFFRIAPTYLCFIFLWFIYKGIVGNLSIQAIVGNLLGVQNFTGFGNEFNWYISALLLFYLFAPIFKAFADRANFKHIIVVFVLLFGLSVSFWNASTYIITITRIPIFLIGFFVGKLTLKKDYSISLKGCIQLIICMIIGFVMLLLFLMVFREYLWSHGLYWYPFVLITPGICLCISYFVFFIQNVKWLRWIVTFLTKIGENSFEIYLLHIPFFDIVKLLFSKYEVLKNYNNIIWFLAFAIIPVLVVCFKIYTKTILGLFRRKVSLPKLDEKLKEK